MDTKSVLSFFRFNLLGMGPKRYFDLTLCCFFISTALFEVKTNVSAFKPGWRYLVRISTARQILPRMLYRNLNPLYSKRGGETIFADPFKKSPVYDTLRLKPLYKWNVCNHLTVVPSAMFNQVHFRTISFLIVFFFWSYPCTTRSVMLLCKILGPYKKGYISFVVSFIVE